MLWIGKHLIVFHLLQQLFHRTSVDLHSDNTSLAGSAGLGGTVLSH